MTYYHLPTDTERAPRRSGEHKVSDGFLLTPPEGGWTDELAAECGFVRVVDTPRPADTATTTHDRSVTRNGDTVTVVWTERPKTQAELDAETQQANQSTVDQAITAALVELQNLIDAPAVADVPAGTMTTAQLSNVARSMRDAVQQNRAGAQKVAQTLKRTIRLVRGDFDSTD